MKYQLAQTVRRSIGECVVGEARLIIGVAKRVTELKTVRRRIEYKEMERQHHSQSSNLHPEGEKINHNMAELSHSYQETPQYYVSMIKGYA